MDLLTELKEINELRHELAKLNKSQVSLKRILKNALKEEEKKFINRTTPHDQRHVVYLKNMGNEIRKLKLEIKDLDRKKEYDKIGHLKRNANLIQKRVNLSIFMKKVSDNPDF